MAHAQHEGDTFVTYLTMIAHICTDLCPGAISATMPFLVVAYGWSYATVGFVVFASSITSAIVQPLFGVLGDRKARPWFMALGVGLAGAGAFATAISGRASECFGVHRLTITCMLLSATLIVAFAFNNSIVMAIAIAMLLSMANNLFYPSSVALGMSYVPLHLGTASGLSYGFAISIGGLATPLLGTVGDERGLAVVMFILAAVALGGVLFGALVAYVDKR